MNKDEAPDPVCKECNGTGEIETAIGMMTCTDCPPAAQRQCGLNQRNQSQTQGEEHMNRWNFRQGFRGRMILQRFVEWMDDGMEHGAWRDATVSDLKDYYDAIRVKGETQKTPPGQVDALVAMDQVRTTQNKKRP